jgi:hypothetical protein
VSKGAVVVKANSAGALSASSQAACWRTRSRTRSVSADVDDSMPEPLPPKECLREESRISARLRSPDLLRCGELVTRVTSHHLTDDTIDT